MRQVNTQILQTSYGDLILGSHNNQLCLCDWLNRKKRESIDLRIQTGLQARYVEKSDEVLESTRVQLTEYFNGKRKFFDIPLLMVGTEFQQSVWNGLLKIPFGVVSNYKSLSESINKIKAVRAVGSANGANAISILIPCHRIIGSNGKLLGYAGGLNAKENLLLLENNLFLSKG